MNRRELIGVLGLGSVAGCVGITLVENTGESPSEQEQTTETGSGDGTADPDVSAEEANATDQPPQERDETTPAEQDQEQEQNQSGNETGNESGESEQSGPDPDVDPRSVIEFGETTVVYDEATDPNYESDELYAEGYFTNTAEFTLKNVRIEVVITVDDEELTRGYTEYVRVMAGEEMYFSVDLPWHDDAIDGQFHPFVSKAEWA